MKSQKIGMIIQARMGSTRLPGKVLKNLNGDQKVLALLLKRMKMCKYLDEIIIATTPDKKNSLIIDLVKTLNVPYFIGSEENVLERYYKCAKEYNLEIILRVTSDCPFVDPKIVDSMIEFYLNNSYDYVRNVDETTNFPVGFNIEIFTTEVLETIYDLAETKPEKEHVTYFIYTHPEIFSIFNYNIEELNKFDDLRLTIDEEEDLIMCREVFKKLKENGKSLDFSIYDVLEIIEKSPELMKINKNVIPKVVNDLNIKK